MNDFRDWWQHLPEQINPVILNLGGFKLQYYGLMYIVAFATVVCLVLFRIKREKGFEITASQIIDLSMMLLVGVIVGGRLGYVLFYNLPYYCKHPLEIFLPFEFSGGIRFVGISGMSFHGGLLGVVISAVLYLRKAGLNFWKTADLFVPAIPLGYTFGRLGNFINGELYGRMTSVPVGMYFPLAPGPELRHPSQLYEAFFEGIFLFVMLWNLRKRKTPPGAMLAFYLMGYGAVRFCIEYYRQPDEHLGFILWSLSMGQVLCGIMMIGGGFLYLYLHRKEKQRIVLP